jgi:electron transfer flavoprotein alpha subunit/NAD-dependent dihydropyrimidine dehydrogenase PreA subunit
MLKIDYEKCIGCGICETVCAFGSMKMENGLPVVDESCVACGECEKACPQEAISISGKSGKTSGFADHHDVWAVMEISAGHNRLKKVSLELLSEARKLADRLGEKVGAVLLCDEIPVDFARQIGEVGCDVVHIVKDGALKTYDTKIFSGIISDLSRACKPSVILFPATENGRDLAPRVSCVLQVGLTADCTGLDIDQDRNLVQVRPTYGGNIMASIISPNHRPQLASVRPNVLGIVKQKKPRDTIFINESIEAGQYGRNARFIESLEKDTVFKDVSEAQVLIVAGYGIGSKENFKKLEKLAVKMNAAIGATRKVVDEGWAPFEIQVGQTGKTVAPDIYIGCGVSGALQHTIGMKNAKYKIAINADPAAPIFGICDVAIMGDCVKTVERICEKLDNGKAV